MQVDPTSGVNAGISPRKRNAKSKKMFGTNLRGTVPGGVVPLGRMVSIGWSVECGRRLKPSTSEPSLIPSLKRPFTDLGHHGTLYQVTLFRCAVYIVGLLPVQDLHEGYSALQSLRKLCSCNFAELPFVGDPDLKLSTPRRMDSSCPAYPVVFCRELRLSSVASCDGQGQVELSAQDPTHCALTTAYINPCMASTSSRTWTQPP